MLTLAEAGEWPPAADETIELIAYQWWASVDREEPFDTKAELLVSLNDYVVANDIQIGEHAHERLKGEAVSVHHSDFAGYAPLVEQRWKARMEVAAALRRGADIAVVERSNEAARRGANPVTMTLDQLMEAWAKETRPHIAKANDKTRYSWERVIGKLIRHVGQSDIRLITEDDVLSWKLSLIDSGLGPKTIKNHLTIAKTLFNFAVGNKLIPSNPASKVTYKGQSDPARMPRSYSDAEAKLVLGEARQQGKGASICDV